MLCPSYHKLTFPKQKVFKEENGRFHAKEGVAIVFSNRVWGEVKGKQEEVTIANIDYCQHLHAWEAKGGGGSIFRS